MKFFQILAVILPLVALFQGSYAKPQVVVSNVDCADEYMKCMDRENAANPMGMMTVAKTCKGVIRSMDVCAGLPAYRTEDNIALG